MTVDLEANGGDGTGGRRQTGASEDTESGERGSGLHVPVSAFANLAEQPQQSQGRIDGETWMRRRPGATFFEELQVSILEVSLILQQMLWG